MVKRAFIIIDLQVDYFQGGRNTLVGINEASANAALLLKKIRSSRVSPDNEYVIIHFRHENEGDPHKVPFFGKGTPGVRIHYNVEPVDGELVVTKNHPNAFVGTNLQEILEENGIKKVVIVGAMAQTCVQGTTRAALELGFEPTVITDAVATKDLEYNGVHVPADLVAATVFATLKDDYAYLTDTVKFLDEL